MLGFLVIVLTVIDIVFQRGSPGDVIDLLDGITIGFQSTKELIEAQPWLTCHVDNTCLVHGWVESG